MKRARVVLHRKPDSNTQPSWAFRTDWNFRGRFGGDDVTQPIELIWVYPDKPTAVPLVDDKLSGELYFLARGAEAEAALSRAAQNSATVEASEAVEQLEANDLFGASQGHHAGLPYACRAGRPRDRDRARGRI